VGNVMANAFLKVDYNEGYCYHVMANALMRGDDLLEAF
jgi:hypothetical protein